MLTFLENWALSRCAADGAPVPGKPFAGRDFHHIWKVLGVALRALGDLDVSEPASLMHGVLHRGLSHTRAVGDLIDWQVAYPVALHLAGDDEKHGALALGVVVAEGIGQRARSAEHPFPVSALGPFFVRKLSFTHG